MQQEIEEEIALKSPPPTTNFAIVVDSSTPDSPLTYETLTLINKMKRAKEESKNPAHFISSVSRIIFGTFFVGGLVIFCSTISICLPIAMIVIGALNIDKCPIQDKIPIWFVHFLILLY